MRKNRFAALVLLGLVCSPVASVNAAEVVIGAGDSGWYTASSHDSSNENYAVGWSNDTYRNFFVFDLTGISGTVVGARLELTNPLANPSGVVYEMYDVTTPIATLTTSQSGATALSIYSDLGTGVFYGSGVVVGSNATAILNSFTMNAAGISAIQASLGQLWALGGKNGGDPSLYAFFSTGVPGMTRSLILDIQPTLPVPEPGTLALLGLGLAGLGLSRRRKTH